MHEGNFNVWLQTVVLTLVCAIVNFRNEQWDSYLLQARLTYHNKFLYRQWGGYLLQVRLTFHNTPKCRWLPFFLPVVIITVKALFSSQINHQMTRFFFNARNIGNGYHFNKTIRVAICKTIKFLLTLTMPLIPFANSLESVSLKSSHCHSLNTYMKGWSVQTVIAWILIWRDGEFTLW